MNMEQAHEQEGERIISGEGKYKERLVTAIEELRNITFLGAKNRTQVKALLSSAWVT